MPTGDMMMTQDRERIEAIGDRLCELVTGDFGGAPDLDRVREAEALVAELRTLLPNTSLSMRLASLLENMRIACSSGRWRRQGLERVQQFAREDAHVIRWHA